MFFAAVGTWSGTELIDQVLVTPPMGTLSCQLLSRGVLSGGNLLRPPQFERAPSMTVGAYDIAFRDLRQKLGGRHQHCPAGHQVECFERGIPVIEIHLMWLKDSMAIQARDCTKLPKHLDSAVLADPHTVDLEFAISPVIRDVCSALALSGRHPAM